MCTLYTKSFCDILILASSAPPHLQETSPAQFHPGANTNYSTGPRHGSSSVERLGTGIHHRQKQSDDPCFKFYGLWLITIMDVNGVYISLLTYIINPIHNHYILRCLYLRNLLYLDLTDVLF
jgi:hypothetical protein